MYEDGSCNGESTYSGPAAGTFSTYRDPYGRASYLVGQVAAPFGSSTFDQNTDFVLLIPFIPFQVTQHTVYSGTQCSGTEDRTAIGNAPYNMPSSLRVCFPATMTPIATGPIVGDWNNAQRQFEFGCTASVTTDDYTATLTVSGVLRPA